VFESGAVDQRVSLDGHTINPLPGTCPRLAPPPPPSSPRRAVRPLPARRTRTRKSVCKQGVVCAASDNGSAHRQGKRPTPTSHGGVPASCGQSANSARPTRTTTAVATSAILRPDVAVTADQTPPVKRRRVLIASLELTGGHLHCAETLDSRRVPFLSVAVFDSRLRRATDAKYGLAETGPTRALARLRARDVSTLPYPSSGASVGGSDLRRGAHTPFRALPDQSLRLLDTRAATDAGRGVRGHARLLHA
jgi:hypothetical protein